MYLSPMFCFEVSVGAPEFICCLWWGAAINIFLLSSSLWVFAAVRRFFVFGATV